MAPLPTLPSPQFDQEKALVKAARKTPSLEVTAPVLPISDQIIKTGALLFEPGSQLVFERLDYPFIAIYADQWSFAGHFEMRRTSKIILDGADGANARAPDPTGPGAGRNGNHGLGGLPGRDGMPGIRMPNVIIFAQQTYVGGRPATVLDVDALFFFDGYPGGNGGNGGRGSDGTDGNQGEPAENGSWGDCAAGPGWGGRGGNAGLGGVPGFGANGGDAPPLYMFVAPDQVPIFNAVVVSLKGGPPGKDGNRGQNGKPGKGGIEGETSGNCGSVGRFGPDGVTPDPCPFPDLPKSPGADGKLRIVDYIGFDELQ
jgi:hypothetical protein